jgi:Domain of unknown function (DUF4342)
VRLLETDMNTNTSTVWESFKAESENALDKVKQVIHEGNVRRVVVTRGGEVVAEFPLTAGVVGAVLAPVLAAIGALVALLKDCTIEIERVRSESARRTDDARPAGQSVRTA